MIINENMKPHEDNLLGMCRAIVKPYEVMMMPKAFMEPSTLPFLKNADALIYTIPWLGAHFIEYVLMFQEGGATAESINNGMENFLYVIEGEAEFIVDGKRHNMEKEGYVWMPPGVAFEVKNRRNRMTRVLWLRRQYDEVKGISVPNVIVNSVLNVKGVQNLAEVEQQCLPFQADLGFDMAMNMLSFAPGVTFPRSESHAFEHGAYFLNGRGLFWINGAYYEVHVDDFSYFAPFVPHYVMSHGPETLRYLLYKNVNRDYPVPNPKA